MRSKVSRRALIKGGLIAGAVLPGLGLIRSGRAAEADLPALDPKDPTAANLGFVNDSSKVDRAANPNYTPDQTCANCQQFTGSRSAARGGCVLFAGKSVPAHGWCKVWRKAT